MNPKINFITVPVADLKESKKFYHEAFGFPISEQNEELCLFELNDNFYFVIQKSSEFNKQTDFSIENYRSSRFILSHNAASKKEVDDIVKKAEHKGAKRIKKMDEDWGYSITIKDIDGHFWEILYTKS